MAVTCEPEEAGIPYVLESVASHTVMYASDYPHWDSEFPESVRKLAGVAGMTEEQRRLVLGRNAKEWFNQDNELPVSSVYFEEKSGLEESFRPARTGAGRGGQGNRRPASPLTS